MSKRKPLFSLGNLTVIAVLTAISFILYVFLKFPLPFLFPSFLEIQISDLPALLAGFSINPLAGVIVIAVKTALKALFASTTAGVGELGDLLVGIAMVLPSAIFYAKHKSKKGAVVSLVIGSLCAVAVAVVVNAFLLIPFYAKLFGGMETIVNLCSALYSQITVDNFYSFYLPFAVIPFNLLRCVILSAVSYFVYKPLSKALHWEYSEK